MNIIQFKKPTKRRFYQFIIKQDNQQWTLISHWGGLDNNIGGKKQEKFKDKETCEMKLNKYIKRRVKRGYELLNEGVITMQNNIVNKQMFLNELSSTIQRLNMLVKYAASQRIELSIFPVLEKQGTVECGVLGYQLKKAY